MKQIKLLLGSAIILAAGSAFATKPTASPKFINYFNQNTCAAVATLPSNCQGGLKQCLIGTDPIVSGSCSGPLVKLRP